MERVIIFLAQLIFTIIGLVVWSIHAGDGPGAGLWLIVDTFPVILFSLLVCIISCVIRKRVNRIGMSSVIICVILFFRWLEGAFGVSQIMTLYTLLNPALPEFLCLIYYWRKIFNQQEK